MGLTRGWWRVPVPHCYFCSIFPKACLFCIVYMGRYMLCVLCMCRYLQRPKEGVRSPVAGVIGSCELPIVGSSVVLETEIRASGRVWSALNYRAISSPCFLCSIPSCHYCFLFHPRVKKAAFCSWRYCSHWSAFVLLLVVVILFCLVFRFPLCIVPPLTSEFTAIIRLPPSWTTLNSCVSQHHYQTHILDRRLSVPLGICHPLWTLQAS